MKYDTIILVCCGGGNECVLVQNNSQLLGQAAVILALLCNQEWKQVHPALCRQDTSSVCDIRINVYTNMINVDMTESGESRDSF
jgi:hypothetical protein